MLATQVDYTSNAEKHSPSEGVFVFQKEKRPSLSTGKKYIDYVHKIRRVVSSSAGCCVACTLM